MSAAYGTFASAAPELAGLGLAVIPVGGDDGKRPLVRWPRWPVGANSEALAAWVESFPNENIGVLTKLSKLAIVDVDDRKLFDVAQRRFGPTPIITRTPSGGAHLWYRANGESSRNLRLSEGLAIDVKAGGASRGGFVVVPPSRRPAGPYAGNAYCFDLGGWADLSGLPKLLPGSLPDNGEELRCAGNRGIGVGAARELALIAIRFGVRNNKLFSALMSKATRLNSEIELATEAAQLNSGFEAPLSLQEVIRVVKSVWGYRERGEIWNDGEPRILITRAELLAFGGDADAFLLYKHLHANHAARHVPFAISPNAMNDAETIPGWGRARYRSSRNALVSLGRVLLVHWGGSGPRDPSLYVLA